MEFFCRFYWFEIVNRLKIWKTGVEKFSYLKADEMKLLELKVIEIISRFEEKQLEAIQMVGWSLFKFLREQVPFDSGKLEQED